MLPNMLVPTSIHNNILNGWSVEPIREALSTSVMDRTMTVGRVYTPPATHGRGYYPLKDFIAFCGMTLERTNIIEYAGLRSRIDYLASISLPPWMSFFINSFETFGNSFFYLNDMYLDADTVYVRDTRSLSRHSNPENAKSILTRCYTRLKSYINKGCLISVPRLLDGMDQKVSLYFTHLSAVVLKAEARSYDFPLRGVYMQEFGVGVPSGASWVSFYRKFASSITNSDTIGVVDDDRNYTLIFKRLNMDKSMLYDVKSHGWDFFGAMNRRILIANKADGDNPIYGIELELSTDYSNRELIDAIEPLWICGKSDSTITGTKPNKIEMVTLPATYRVHKKLWASWFNALNINKFDTSRNTNNGMHVHISREAFDNERHKRDFAWFFTAPMMHKYMIEASERGELNQWCAMPPIKSTEREVHVRRNIVNLIGGQRGVINFGKSATIEVRLFRGIVSYATVMKNLDLVDAVFYFTRESIPYTVNPLDLFVKWLENTPDNKYEALKEFMFHHMDLDGAVAYAKAHQIIAGCDSHIKAANKITRSSVILDEDCVEILNSHYKGRYFKFDGTLNRVVPVERKGVSKDIPTTGILAHRDKDFISKSLGTSRNS